ncbi:alpha/beta hydrolase family protein [Ensifer adhaerens]|uniref:alpha/beta hydrolase family protein n=1 Tax=Ensifer adhaerens TaxID=106592 RepID=UPI00098EA014|nr:dienelactone hydrolase family protein [Ensifer adhaerens]
MSISRERLHTLLGLADTELVLEACETDEQGSHLVERLRFRSLRNGAEIRGLLTRPPGNDGPRPAILYAHAHGGRYEIGASELLDGRPALLGPPGPVLAEHGFVTLCIDMPTFGERSNVTESAAAKAALWYGRTLFGQMLAEQQAALTWLSSREDVDANRIGMTGISMGATLSYFLAALDTRIAATAHLCCFADFASLIETGAHDRHGHYLTVPRLLAETSTGAIAGLVAPRPQLICVGLDDPLTPPPAVERAYAETLAAYRAAGAGGDISLVAEPGVGHVETRTMRDAALAFLTNRLAGTGSH